MGDWIIKWWGSSVKPAWKRAFFSALVFGLIAHIYKFTNTLLIHDSLYFVHTDIDIGISGRWLLNIAGAIGSGFDLPWINGLLSLIYIGITAAVIVDIFAVENPVAQVLTGALLVTFPCITNTFFFEYSADAYMLSMLLAALTVRFSMVGDNKKSHWIIAAVLICMSLGIYQSYLSFALILAVCHFGWELLENSRDKKQYWVWILKQIIVYGLGAAMYVLIWRLTDSGADSSSGYQGISSAGAITMASIGVSVKDCLRTVAQLFLGQNVLEHGWTVYAGLNAAFLLLFATALVVAVIKSKLYRRLLELMLFLLCLAVVPFFAGIWFFASTGVFYHPLMLQSLAVIYVYCVYLVERYFTVRGSTVAVALFAALVMKFTVHANVCYSQMNQSMERSLSMATEMLTRVHMMDDGSVKKIAVVGYDYSSALYEEPELYKEIAFSANQLRPHLLYNNDYAQMYLHEILGCEYEAVYNDELVELENSDEVQAMTAWPTADSVKIIGDTAVIKLPLDTLDYE